jgi:hypothetical protein
MMRTEAPEWLLAFWKEIDDKTFGKGFDCLAEDATCNLGVADWHGREQIRENLRAFIDTGFTALHDIRRDAAIRRKLGGSCGGASTAGLSRIRWTYCGSKDSGTTEEARKVSRREDSKRGSTHP